MREECEKCVIRDLNSLNSVTAVELQAIAKKKSTIHIQKGEVIFSEGTSLRGVYCLEMVNVNSQSWLQMVRNKL